MDKKRHIRVLWVENDPLITSAYPREAELLQDIILHPYPNWEEAEKEIENNYEYWDAIILDAKCKYKKDDADKATRFLSNVFPKIEKVASRKNRTIPWYVLSGQGEDDIRDLIPDTNEWDNDWVKLSNRRFYSKNGIIEVGSEKKQERHILFERIRMHVLNLNPQLRIEYDLYPDVFFALDVLALSGEVGYHLMHLLLPIHYPGTSNLDYNNRYFELRKSLEHIFRHMYEMKILPTVIIGKDKRVNLSWSSHFLGGKQPDDPSLLPDTESSKKLWKKVKRKTSKPILPKQIGNWLKEAIFQTGSAVHTSEAETDAETKVNLDKYLPLVDQSPYMLRLLTMGLCDFILWYKGFFEKNPDPDLNEETYWTLRNQKF